jgi:hypothetical protein
MGWKRQNWSEMCHVEGGGKQLDRGGGEARPSHSSGLPEWARHVLGRLNNNKNVICVKAEHFCHVNTTKGKMTEFNRLRTSCSRQPFVLTLMRRLPALYTPLNGLRLIIMRSTQPSEFA